MTFPSLIQEALAVYDQKKSAFGKKNPFVSALKRLPQTERANNFEIFKCFINNDSGFSSSNASFGVLIAFIEHVLATSFNDDRILLELLHYYKCSDIKIVFGLTASSDDDSNTIHVYWDEHAQQIKYFTTFNYKGLINAEAWDERKITIGYLTKNDLPDDYNSIVKTLKTELVVRQHHLKKIGQEKNKDIVPFFDAVTFDIYPEAETSQLFSIFRALVNKRHIQCHDHDPYKALAILKFCHSSRFINRDNFNFVFVRIFEYCRTPQCGDDALSMLTFLHKAGLLTQHNFNKVFSNQLSERSDYIRWAIEGFFNSSALTQSNFDVVFKPKGGIEYFYNALRGFYSRGRWPVSSQHINVSLKKRTFDELQAISIFNLDSILEVFALRLRTARGLVLERDVAKYKQFNDGLITSMLSIFQPLVLGNCFTPENVEVLKRVGSPKQFAELIALTFNAGCSIITASFKCFNIDDLVAACRALNTVEILTQINFDALLRAPKQKVFADALILLHSANILTEQNRTKLLNLSEFVPPRLKRLSNKGILTQENLDALLNATSPDKFLDILEILQDANCLTQQNRANFLMFSGSITPFVSLYKKGIFTQDNLDALLIAKSPDNFVKILEALHYSQCLTSKNRETFLTFTGSINPFITLYKKALLTQENLDALLISTSPEKFADILEILTEAKCLSQQNRTAFLKFTGSIKTLKEFYDTGLLKQTNLDAFLKAKSPENFVKILVILHQLEMLTPKTRMIFSNLTKSIDPFITLYNQNTLTQENLDGLLSAKSPEKFVEILGMLENTPYLTQQNRVAFLKFTGPIEPFQKLCKNNLLTQETLNLFLISKSPEKFTEAMIRLQSAKCPLPENKINFLDFLNVPNALEILNTLRQENSLTEENLEPLISSVYPDKFIDLLLILKRANYLTPQNRAALQTFYGEKNAFQALHAARILTQDNIDLLFDQRNNYLSSQEATRILWARLPTRLFTQDVFDHLIMHARAINPQNSIQNYVTQVLAPPPPRPTVRANPHFRGDSQSTHRVHDTVAASLRRLALRYPLTESAMTVQLSAFERFAVEIKTGKFNHLNTSTAKFKEDKCMLANASINRLILLTKNHSIQDSQTQFTLKKIITLIWMAVQDEGLHDKSIGLNAKERLINELSNIQSAYGVDSLGRGSPSCSGGTINGLVNILDGIHPDVTLVLMTNETVHGLMLKHARKIFMESLVQKTDEPQFIKQVCQEMNSTQSGKWSFVKIGQWYEDCLKQTVDATEQETSLYIQQAQLLNNQMVSLQTNIRNAWIPDSLKGLRNKYMLDDVYPGYESMNFDLLIKLIEESISAERELQNTASVSHSNIFSKINFEKIKPFMDLLRTQKTTQALIWLQTKENRDELMKGTVLFSCLQKKLNQQRPLGCTNLEELENYLLEKSRSEPILNLQTASK